MSKLPAAPHFFFHLPGCTSPALAIRSTICLLKPNNQAKNTVVMWHKRLRQSLSPTCGPHWVSASRSTVFCSQRKVGERRAGAGEVQRAEEAGSFDLC